MLMKRMMSIMMIAICCMLSCHIMANADNDTPIAVTSLPAKAQALLSKHFSNQKVALATIESGVISKSYDVVLKNGTKHYLKDNYAKQSVKKIEIDKNEYEIELSNGLDLTFNKHFKLIDID